MNGRLLSAVLMALVLFMACFVAGPVSSGEHPWGSDRGDDGFGGTTDTIVRTLDTIVRPDTTYDPLGTGGAISGSFDWLDWFTCICSAVSAGL